MSKDKATLNVSRELHRELKIEAAKRGLKLGELVEMLLKTGLERIRRD